MTSISNFAFYLRIKAGFFIAKDCNTRFFNKKQFSEKKSKSIQVEFG